jgi:hypothetical protein
VYSKAQHVKEVLNEGGLPCFRQKMLLEGLAPDKITANRNKSYSTKL